MNRLSALVSSVGDASSQFTTALGFESTEWSASVWLVWLMFHFLWQGALIFAFVFLGNSLGRGLGAKFRHSIAVVGLALMPIAILVTWWQTTVTDSTMPPAALSSTVFASPEAAEPSATIGAIVEASAKPEVKPSPSFVRRWSGVATMLYVAGFATMCFRLILSSLGVWRFRKNSSIVPPAIKQRVKILSKQIGLRYSPDLHSCERIVVPLAVGVLKPAILLPASMLSGLTQLELDGILLHELAHLKRFDVWVNYLQRITEALLFFHPCVWYVSRQITIERENCCDDLVLTRCERDDYLRGLLQLAERCVGQERLAPVSALAATGARPSELRRRVMRIMGVQTTRQFGRSSMVAALAGVCIIGLAAFYAHAQADQHDHLTVEDSPKISAAADSPLTFGFNRDGKIVRCELLLPRDVSVKKVSVLLDSLSKTNLSSVNMQYAGKHVKFTITGDDLPSDVLRAAVFPPQKKPDEDSLKKKKSGQKKTDAVKIDGPVQIEFIEGTDIFITRGRKEDVDRFQKVIKGFEERAKSEAEDKAKKRAKLEGAVQVELIEGTDTLVARGKKEDVERFEKIMKEVRESQAADKERKLPASDKVRSSYTLPSDKTEDALRQRIAGFLAGKGIAEKRIHLKFSDGKDKKPRILTIEATISEIVLLEEYLKSLGAKFYVDKNTTSLIAYKLKNAKAKSVAKTLRTIYADALESIRIANPDDGHVIVFATQEQHAKIAELIKQLDSLEKVDAIKSSQSYLLRNTDAKLAANTVERMLGPKNDVTIAVDERTNVLIVTGPKETQAAVSKLLTQLDGSAAKIIDRTNTGAEAALKAFDGELNREGYERVRLSGPFRAAFYGNPKPHSSSKFDEWNSANSAGSWERLNSWLRYQKPTTTEGTLLFPLEVEEAMMFEPKSVRPQR